MSSDSDIELGDHETFEAKVKFTCPFCGKNAAIGVDAEGNGGVLHALPYCFEFESKDALDFAQAVRARFQN